MNTILAATDGSEDADRAIDMAASLAKATGAKLLVVTVGHELASADIEKLARAEGGLGEAYERVYNEILRTARVRALARGAPAVEMQLGWGDPADVIIDLARRVDADLVVVGRRGRGKVASVLLGSVSHELIAFAPCAVVVVP